MLARGTSKARGFAGLLAAMFIGGVVGCGPSAMPDMSRIDFTPEGTRTGPVAQEFNSDDFAITRVLRQPKQLSAFGQASLYDDSREVGRMDDGQKDLRADQQGERIVFSWKYTGAPGAAATARIELFRLRDMEPVVIEESYTGLQPGRHRIAYNNRGANYRRQGAVNRWQIQIIAGGAVVAQRQSSLWSAASGAATGGQPPAEATPE
ncbi:MAG: hypothetical protein JW889_03495 [Verrucomicrobia bacterium]|nr:hypothetical protein [Verrucomicrobiota bacterium]